MFTNKLIGDVYATRFIMSWVRMGGKLGKRGDGVDDFRKWLTSLDLDSVFFGNYRGVHRR